MTKRFVVLDSFRGLLAIVVALYHYREAGPISNFILIKNGSYFVDFFFVLSGFIIYHNYSNLSIGRQQMQFMKNRFYRLYPLHIVLLIFFLFMEIMKYLLYNYGIFKSPVFEKNNLFSFIVNLFFLQSFNLCPNSWNYPSWSISAEMVAYLTFCLVIVFIKRFSFLGRVCSFLLISVSSLLLIKLIIGNYNIEITTDYGMFRCIYGFFIGCLTYELYVRIAKLKKNKYTSVLECLTLILCLITTAFIPERFSFLNPVAYACAVICFAFEFGIISMLLTGKIFNKIGHLSYSMYMTHAAIAILFELAVKALKIQSPLGLSSITLIYISTIIVISTFTHQYIEVGIRKKISTFKALNKSKAQAV